MEERQSSSPAKATADDEKPQTADDGQVAFESLFTLPFALHLRPLPHVSYLAEQDSGQSSEQEGDDDQKSDVSSQGSNYRAGTHRLEPQTHAVPPHSLKTISMLLERTGCLDSVSAWSELLEMLDKADEDPHFANLRAFFDARFDSSGYLKGPDGSRIQRNLSRRRKGNNNGGGGGFKSPVAGSPPRSGSSGGANVFGLLNRRQSSRYASQDEEFGGESVPNRAPEIIMVGRNGNADSTVVRFKVRLDLHQLGLAPKPPKAPSTLRKASVRTSLQRRLGNSPTKRALASGDHGNDLQKVLSNASSDQSHAENLSLHPVRSPDSFRSRPFSDGSDDYSMGRRGSDALSATSMPSKGRGMLKKASRNSTTSSAVTASMATSDLGTSPPDSHDGGQRSRPGLFGSFSYNKNVADGSRRPSMIQRLMDFKGLRGGNSQASKSKDSVSSETNERSTEEKAMADVRVISSEGGVGNIASAHRADRVRSQTASSDLSNEDALDMADEDASNASASQILVSGLKRRTSSNAGPQSMLGFTPAPDMIPVEEGAATMSNSDAEFSDENGGTSNATDFITLLRRAANTSLTLRRSELAKIVSPTRTPRGMRSAGSASIYSPQDVAETPPGSVEWEEQERVEALLAPFKQTDPSWWLSGAVDPLPVSIACALSQALGWNGVMDLCYGKQSRSARAKIFQPLGKAAEMERKMESEKRRVESWAQGVAVVDTAASGDQASGLTSSKNDGQLSVQDIETRDRLASMKLSTDAGSDVVAPSESASMQLQHDKASDVNGKISTWLRQKSGGVLGSAAAMGMTSSSNNKEQQQKLDGLGLFDQGKAKPMFSSPFANASSDNNDVRSWQDWADLTRSMADWLQEYETTRVRNGMAGEVGHEVQSSTHAVASKSATEMLETNFDESTAKMRYSGHASYQVPFCVVKDALNKHNSFRRRHGIPEGLPIGPDGQEIGDYRWARKRLSHNHFATSTTLAAGSLAHCMQQLATSDWTHASAWELDYLEMCVFKNPIMAKRFPSPTSAIVPADQTFSPADDEDQRARAKPCPYPSAEGEWSSSSWLQWLRTIRNGMIIVPAVSWQAWWTLIAVLNGGDGSDRALDVQLKAEEESFSDLDDAEAVYL